MPTFARGVCGFFTPFRMTILLQNKGGTARRPFPTRARKIDVFRGMWMPLSPTDSNVGKDPIRHINVKHRHTSRLRYIATKNHSSVIVRRGGRPRPPMVSCGKVGFKTIPPSRLRRATSLYTREAGHTVGCFYFFTGCRGRHPLQILT